MTTKTVRWRILYEVIPMACVVVTMVALWIGFESHITMLCVQRGLPIARVSAQGVRCEDGVNSFLLRYLDCPECYRPPVPATEPPEGEHSL